MNNPDLTLNFRHNYFINPFAAKKFPAQCWEKPGIFTRMPQISPYSIKNFAHE